MNTRLMITAMMSMAMMGQSEVFCDRLAAEHTIPTKQPLQDKLDALNKAEQKRKRKMTRNAR